jgi:hypothetical protein
VFKVKYESDGSIQRFRARFVAKGFTQAYGTDYWDTYSPVFSYTSLRTIFAIATERDMQLDQFDLKNGFIQQRIDVDHLYMECPDGYSKEISNGVPAALNCLQSVWLLEHNGSQALRPFVCYFFFSFSLSLSLFVISWCNLSSGASGTYDGGTYFVWRPAPEPRQEAANPKKQIIVRSA